MPANILQKTKICIIGPGRLGLTLAYCFLKDSRQELSLVSVSARRAETIENVKNILNIPKSKIFFSLNNIEAAQKADCIMICTPDDEIKKVCDEIFLKKPLKTKIKTVIHFSGLKNLDVLESAKLSGTSICCIHPMKSFANYLDSAKSMRNTLFGVTYDKQDKQAALEVKKIVNFFKGESIYVKNDLKAIYHACACVASNYLAGLLNIVEKMGKEIGIEPDVFMNGIFNLSQGTLDNIKKLGTSKALTGPIARGDIGTIKTHLEKIESGLDKDFLDVYKLLGKFTARIAFENNWINKKIFEEFQNLFTL